jgi:glycosyltransferase involved in cell wall biosynthesis
VLLLSHRNVHPAVSRCMTYEFEDLIGEVDAADLASVNPAPWPRSLLRLERLLPAAFARFAPSAPVPARRYDLLYLSLHTPSDLARVQPIGRWLGLAERSACNIDEVWLHDLAVRTGDLAMLRRFDCVFTACRGAVEELERLLGRPCHYLPPSADSLRFAPAGLERLIDVYFMGRRRPELQAALSVATRRKGYFYHFDTVCNPLVTTYLEHRLRLAELVQRTRYFIVDVANADRVEQSGAQPEIGTRFFEGAAGGAVMLGIAPDTDAFRSLFGWQDAVIPVEPDEAALTALFDELDADPERVEGIRRRNASQALRRHDGVYRWEQILRAVGLEPLPALGDRKERLERRAKEVETCRA